ncbi:MAG TPA: ABC transporter permease [Pirellulales bacterium]|nr:ABC transporter permease [Pirellulales bacterium]
MQKELQEVFLGRGFWAALLISVLLSGYSYIQAVKLYGQASQTAEHSPELARGLSPLDGILVPSFGGLYLIASLLYPFVVIRTIGVEKQSGAVQLLLQLPYSLGELIAAKLTAALVAWTILVLPCLMALVLWAIQGGHLGGWETANLLLGHCLFALVTAGISLTAAATTESAAGASIAAISVMAGFWVLDFASTGEDGLLKSLSDLSLTRELKSFESGLFSLSIVVGSLSAAFGLAILAGVWLRRDWSRVQKWPISVLTVAVTALAILAAAQLRFYRDAAEDRRNSFHHADEAVLRTADGRLIVQVFLLPSDPRAYDLERSVLAKLRRTMPCVSVNYEDAGGNRFLSGQGDDYGKVIYSYNDRQTMSRSTNEDEILSIVFELLGSTRTPTKPAECPYPGYPLEVSSRPAEILFYYVLPATVLCCWALAAGGWRIAKNVSPRMRSKDSSTRGRRNP